MTGLCICWETRQHGRGQGPRGGLGVVRVTAAWAWSQPMRTGRGQSDSCLGVATAKEAQRVVRETQLAPSVEQGCRPALVLFPLFQKLLQLIKLN